MSTVPKEYSCEPSTSCLVDCDEQNFFIKKNFIMRLITLFNYELIYSMPEIVQREQGTKLFELRHLHIPSGQLQGQKF